MSVLSAALVAEAQVYESLSREIQEISMEANPDILFQFAAFPLSAVWQTGTEPSACDWCDLTSPRRDGCYIPGSARFSMGYRDLLLSADLSALGEIERAAVLQSLSCMQNKVDMRIDGSPLKDAAQWEQREDWAFTCKTDSTLGADNAFIRLFQGANPVPENPLDSLLQQCTYTLRVKGFALYEMKRGDWCFPALVYPAFPLLEGGTLQQKVLFGLGGALQHTPTHILVSYAPELVLHVTQFELPRLMGRNSDEDVTLRIGGMEFSLLQGIILPQANAFDSDPQFDLLLPALKHEPQIWGMVSRKHYA